MPTETEHRFFVNQSKFNSVFEGFHWPHVNLIEQGYISNNEDFVQRIRLQTDVNWHGDQSAFLTIKTNHTGISCSEYEYSIPPVDAKELLKLSSGSIVQKIRYKKPYSHNTDTLHLNVEVDVFLGANIGLAIVEVEVPDETEDLFPEIWFGDEITNTKLARHLSNAALSAYPLNQWTEAELKPIQHNLWRQDQ